MHKLTLAFLVVIIALAPAFAQASGGGTDTKGSSPSGTKSGAGSGPSTTPGASGGSSSSSSPSASPSGADDSFSKYTTKADCEKAGGMWTEAAKSCKKK
jgi:hypothetical protein